MLRKRAERAADGGMPGSGARSESRSVPECRNCPPEAACGGADDAVCDGDVRRARDGDDVAFSRLFRHVQPSLLRYLTVMVGPEAEDVAAETWSQVCRDLHTFSGSLDGWRGWVVTIARNRALDHLRRTRRRPATLVPPEDLAVLTISAPDDAAQTAVERIASEAALGLLRDLPPDQAEAIMLRVVLDLDAATAGTVLGKSAGAVRVAAHRGLRTLAGRLESGGYRSPAGREGAR